MVHFNIWIQPRLVFSCEFTCISLKRKQCKRAESSSVKSNPADNRPIVPMLKEGAKISEGIFAPSQFICINQIFQCRLSPSQTSKRGPMKIFL